MFMDTIFYTFKHLDSRDYVFVLGLLEDDADQTNLQLRWIWTKNIFL